MDTGKLAGMVEIFEGLEDWRSTQQTRHRLSELLTMAMCAVLSGAERIAQAVRSHWEVDNQLHWCLDVQFGDDYARGRTGHTAHNPVLVRHMAFNPIRLDKSIKTSIKTKRLLAATSDEFRATLLGFESHDQRMRTTINEECVDAGALRAAPTVDGWGAPVTDPR